MITKAINIISLCLIPLLISCSNSNTSDKTISTSKENVTNDTSKENTKVEVFNDVDKTRDVLSENGIGQLKKWRSDEMGGYMSITDYFEFGNNGSLGSPNNLAYYLESDKEHCIKTLKLVLNINNKEERKLAITKFKDLTIATYKSLNLTIPNSLLEAIKKSENFQDNNEIFTTSLKLDKSKIDSWELIIRTN